MTEPEFIDRILRLLPSEGTPPSRELLDITAAAVEQFPDSPPLLSMRADVYILAHSPWSDNFDPNIPLALYQRILSLENDNAAALVELGYLYDVYFQDFDHAEKAFRKAISLGSGQPSYFGLARVLAQMGRSEEALAVLCADQCPYSDDDDVRELVSEISEGIWDPQGE